MASARVSNSSTCWPLLANSWAIPRPMAPAPITPIRLNMEGLLGIGYLVSLSETIFRLKSCEIKSCECPVQVDLRITLMVRHKPQQPSLSALLHHGILHPGVSMAQANLRRDSHP